MTLLSDGTSLMPGKLQMDAIDVAVTGWLDEKYPARKVYSLGPDIPSNFRCRTIMYIPAMYIPAMGTATAGSSDIEIGRHDEFLVVRLRVRVPLTPTIIPVDTEISGVPVRAGAYGRSVTCSIDLMDPDAFDELERVLTLV